MKKQQKLVFNMLSKYIGMEFVNDYKQFHQMRIPCNNIKKFLKIKKYLFGHGGSDNIIVIGTKNKKDMVLKFMLYPINDTSIIKEPNTTKVEVDFYDFLTRNIILKNISPFIVGLFGSYKCKNINILLPNNCPDRYNNTFKKIKQERDTLCGIKNLYNSGMVKKKYVLVNLEYAPLSIDTEIEKIIQKLAIYEIKKDANKKKIKETIEEIKLFIDRVVFQIVFTLAHILKLYPNFRHNDLFLRNILGVQETNYNDNDYVEYKFNKTKHYFKANGFYSKINDFGTSSLYPLIKNDHKNVNESWNKLRGMVKYKHHKNDLFQFIKDFYDGQNLGCNSTMTLLTKYKIQNSSIDTIDKHFDKYIKTSTLKKIMKNNKKKLNRMWYIDGNKQLENTIKYPYEYLNRHFKKNKKLPNNGNIVHTFG